MPLDDQIQEIFERAGLSESDRELWLSRLSSVSERMKAVFVSIFSDDTELLRFFTGDLKNRIEAGDDQERLAKIIEDERGYFRDFLSQQKT